MHNCLPSSSSSRDKIHYYFHLLPFIDFWSKSIYNLWILYIFVLCNFKIKKNVRVILILKTFLYVFCSIKIFHIMRKMRIILNIIKVSLFLSLSFALSEVFISRPPQLYLLFERSWKIGTFLDMQFRKLFLVTFSIF